MTHSVQSTHPREAMKRDRLWFATVVLLILLPSLNTWGANAYMNASQSGALSRWRRLKPLRARAVDIVGASHSTVYVRTDTGDHYACRHRGESWKFKRCWYKVQSVPTDARRAPSDPLFYKVEVRPPPAGTVVDSLERTVAGAEAWSQTRYLLMQDGSMFAWHCHGGIGGWLTVGLGFVGGLALAGVLVAVLWKRAGRPSS
jgi:hypothetical protein